jgi:predicted kinase
MNLISTGKRSSHYMSESIKPTLFIVCGLPGAGKTTHATQLERKYRAVRFCPDEWMNDLGINIYDEEKRSQIEPLQWKFCKRLLELGVSCIIEWGTWSRSERELLRVEAREVGAAVELHYLSLPLDVLFERISARGAEDPPIKRAALEEWNRLFEQPSSNEIAFFDNYVCMNNKS